MAADTWLYVHGRDGEFFRCDPVVEPSLDAWFGDYLSSGKTRDKMLELPTIYGYTVRIAASDIAFWFLSTPATRLAEADQDKWDRDEMAEHRAAVGDFDGDEVYD